MSEVTRIDDLGSVMRNLTGRLEALERPAVFRLPIIAGIPDAVEDGDVWIDSTNNTLKVRINGATVTVTVT